MRKNTMHTFDKLKRAAAFVLSAVMLLSLSVSCGSAETSGEKANNTLLSEKEEKSLEDFLVRFVKGYPVSSDGLWDYDCSRPLLSSGNLLACVVTPSSCADWTLYSDVIEEECFIEKADDPREWAKETYCYYRYDAETVEFIAREIFNLSEKDIRLLTVLGESGHLFYKENGSYYTVSDGTNDAYANVDLKSVAFDGKRYMVEFDANTVQKTDNSDELLSVSGRMNAELELKTLRDRKYWSLYSFRTVKK